MKIYRKKITNMLDIWRNKSQEWMKFSNILSAKIQSNLLLLEVSSDQPTIENLKEYAGLSLVFFRLKCHL